VTEYKALTTEGHGRDEELQWARILSSGKAAQGMAIIFIQKMCAAFHEFEPAWRAGALNDEHLPFFRTRLAARTRKVLYMLRANDLDKLSGVAELEAVLCAVQSAKTMAQLADLAEKAHAANHTLTDALEKTC
jgi:hypothetical protein